MPPSSCVGPLPSFPSSPPPLHSSSEVRLSSTLSSCPLLHCFPLPPLPSFSSCSSPCPLSCPLPSSSGSGSVDRDLPSPRPCLVYSTSPSLGSAPNCFSPLLTPAQHRNLLGRGLVPVSLAQVLSSRGKKFSPIQYLPPSGKGVHDELTREYRARFKYAGNEGWIVCKQGNKQAKATLLGKGGGNMTCDSSTYVPPPLHYPPSNRFRHSRICAYGKNRGLREEWNPVVYVPEFSWRRGEVIPRGSPQYNTLVNTCLYRGGCHPGIQVVEVVDPTHPVRVATPLFVEERIEITQDEFNSEEPEKGQVGKKKKNRKRGRNASSI